MNANNAAYRQVYHLLNKLELKKTLHRYVQVQSIMKHKI